MLGTTLAPPQLISMPEIAELAGVRRPVVTTWRRRHPDFPAPTETDGGKPLFDARRVVDWLVETGRAERRQIEADLRLHMLACLVTLGRPTATNGRPRGVRPMPARDLVGAITALICLRHLDDDLLRPDGYADRHVIAALRDRAADVDPDDDLLRAEVDALPADAAWLAAAVDELIEAAWGCRQAYERVLAARHRLAVPELYVDAVTPMLARLIAGLSGAREHADVYGTVRIADPGAGAGDLLMAVRDQIAEDHSPIFTAAEVDPFLARVVRRRLAVHDVPAEDRRIHVGSDLPARPVPDVLVTQVPYQPKEDRGDADPLAGVRRVVDGLAPGQTAVVLGPADLLVAALPPYRPAARTRNELLTSGRVEAVINLPGGLVPFRPGYRTALWVLRHEDPSPWQGRVLLADVSDRPLTAEVVDTLIWDVTTWRREGYRPDQHLRAYASQVAVSELVVPRRPLIVRRPPRLRDLTQDARQTVAHVAEIEADLDQLTRPVPERQIVHSGLAVRDDRSAVPSQSIGLLVRNGLLVMRKGYRIAADDIVVDGHHRVLGAAELTGRAVQPRSIDREVLARHPRLRLTEPDDVVVTVAPRFAVLLDRDGFSVVEYPARVLRIPPAGRRWFTPRVLAALLATAAPTARAAGAIRPALRLDEVQLPLLQPAEVEHLDALLAAADARRAVARRELDLLDELCRIAVTGLTDGSLTITRPPSGG